MIDKSDEGKVFHSCTWFRLCQVPGSDARTGGCTALPRWPTLSPLLPTESSSSQRGRGLDTWYTLSNSHFFFLESSFFSRQEMYIMYTCFAIFGYN